MTLDTLKTLVGDMPDPNVLLTREQAARALSDAGYPTATSTLTTKACRGGGPVYRLFGVRALYRWADLLEWAESKTSAPRRNTSDPLRYNTAN